MKQLQQRVKALYDDTTAKNILMWLYGDFPQEDKDAIVQLLQDDPSQLKELFGKTLTFGTGGLRSPMGMGTNRMNTFTVSRASQGISLVLRRHQLLSSSTLR
ncbi:phosphomannomutase [Chlamydia pecorum MC/MarsBar]|nr:phosphomannomutase [Chlamydia pecorum MC/MarsBar]